MKTSLLAGLLACATLAATTALGGCASDTDSRAGGSSATTPGGSASGAAGSAAGEIVLGSVNSLSGIVTFPEASSAAKAVFDEVNAAGGINGHKVSYVVADDKVDPAAAAQAARDLVENRHAVALVGGASLIECQVNAAYYATQKIMSVPGLGVDPMCFSSPVISPVNPGPFLDTRLSLTYGSETLGLKKICAFVASAGNAKPKYLEQIDAWSRATGKKPAYVDDTVANGSPDFTPQVVRAKQEKCDGIFVNMPESDDLGFLKAASAQGLTDVTWLFLTSAYSEELAKAAGSATGKGIYLPAEFYPFTDRTDPVNKAWIDLMTRKNIPLTSFAQAGYVAANNLVTVLKGIKGEVTRESVTQALRTMTPIDNPMVGTPYVFGPGEKHNSATAGYEVVLRNGAWTKAGTGWTVLPS